MKKSLSDLPPGEGGCLQAALAQMGVDISLYPEYVTYDQIENEIAPVNGLVSIKGDFYLPAETAAIVIYKTSDPKIDHAIYGTIADTVGLSVVGLLVRKADV